MKVQLGDGIGTASTCCCPTCRRARRFVVEYLAREGCRKSDKRE